MPCNIIKVSESSLLSMVVKRVVHTIKLMNENDLMNRLKTNTQRLLYKILPFEVIINDMGYSVGASAAVIHTIKQHILELKKQEKGFRIY